jgi:hypothetical protein
MHFAQFSGQYTDINPFPSPAHHKIEQRQEILPL